MYSNIRSFFPDNKMHRSFCDTC